jgi:predicted nucleotidyltransferase
MTFKSLEHKIIECIKPLNAERIIIFGSMAYGKSDFNSDLDILIVTSDNLIPANLKDFLKLKKPYSDALSVIRNDMPIDLIVHTLPMYRKFIELGSSFSHEVLTKGKVIYERIDQAMA